MAILLTGMVAQTNVSLKLLTHVLYQQHFFPQHVLRLVEMLPFKDQNNATLELLIQLLDFIQQDALPHVLSNLDSTVQLLQDLAVQFAEMESRLLQRDVMMEMLKQMMDVQQLAQRKTDGSPSTTI
jgi:hypothetical protein